MLKLVDIQKDYRAGDAIVCALKGVSLTFRDSEFVSILGPSGCGKTTLLNIVGGLDHCSRGDLLIDGISTKKFTDRDWDTYRNHRIGFVFQSYNLIPHQTILENVELALNISGIEKSERISRSKKALDEVGLKGQYNKRPNQLSGGQCQRVAIARALVNEPDILLADEPTGALDTNTSVQIMDLIKKISEKRLVIMVTHNPDLAEKYSTRIIRLLDGEVIDDSNPVREEEKIAPSTAVSGKKSKLGLLSAFRLSARNLRSKFKRTAMVCFAGSIGIIGVATVLAVSSGVQGYIASMQDDMLSGNPIRISEEALDISKILDSANGSTKNEAVKDSIEDGYINVDKAIETLIQNNNDIDSFKVSNTITQDYIDYVYAMPKEYYASIVSYFGIDVTNNIYTPILFANSDQEQKMSLSAILTTYNAMLQLTDYKDLSNYLGLLEDCFIQAPDEEDFILSQYEFVSDPEQSKIAKEADEIMIVLDEESRLTDLLLAQLGYYTQEEFFNIVYHATDDTDYLPSLDKDKFSYEELMNKEFIWYPNDTVFNETDADSPLAKINPFTYNPLSSDDWNNGIKLKVTAILKPKKDIHYGSLTSGFYYTSAFSERIIRDSLNSKIVAYADDQESDSIISCEYNGMATGIVYQYGFRFEHGGEVTEKNGVIGYVGKANSMSAILGQLMGQGTSFPATYELTLRALGGKELPEEIAVYPIDFKLKDEVTGYLDAWNSDQDIEINGKTLTKEDRNNITYTDNLSVVIKMINGMIQIVTYALVAFTSLSLVVSTVMIAIITYVSVIERIKEIGVIRSLGGRKKDVSRLFNAETFIIGGISGLIGIGITYLISLVINMIVGSLTGIYTIAALPWYQALIMIAISIALTLISGLVPARLAAKKDPVDALRSE